MALAIPDSAIHSSPISSIVTTSVSVLKIDCPIGFEVIVDLPLQNESNQLVAFKVKTNRKERYMVQPPRGVLKPGELKQVHIVLIPQVDCPDSSKDKFLVQSVPLESPEDVEAAATAESWWKPYEKLHNPKQSQYTFSQFVVPAQLVPTGSRPGGSAFSSPVGTSPLRAPPGQQSPIPLSSHLQGVQQQSVGSLAPVEGASPSQEPNEAASSPALHQQPAPTSEGSVLPGRPLPDSKVTLGAAQDLVSSAKAAAAVGAADPAEPDDVPPAAAAVGSSPEKDNSKVVTDLRRRLAESSAELEKEKRRAGQEMSDVRGAAAELRRRCDALSEENDTLTKALEKLQARVASLQRVDAASGLDAHGAGKASHEAAPVPDQPGVSVRTILVVILAVLISLIILLWKG